MTLLARAGKLAGPDRGWQPIETAPKDGTEVLVTNGVTIKIGVRKRLPESGGRYEWFRDEEVIPGHSWSIRGCTHWMPLPEPPAAAALNPQETTS